MTTKQPYNPDQGNLFPDQLELFAHAVNRGGLPIDVVISPTEVTVSPDIDRVLKSVADELGKFGL